MSGTQGTQSKHSVTALDNLPGYTLRNGDYKIEKVLGQGGMGRVFLASHTTLLVPLAIKQGLLDQPVPEAVLAELDRVLHTNSIVRRTATHTFTEHDFPL